MYYAIFTYDNDNSLQKRLEARSAHLQRLESLQNQGRLLLAGPHPAIDSLDPGPAGFTGSLIVAEFVDLPTATAWAEADPYVSAGVVNRLEVKPFKKVLP